MILQTYLQIINSTSLGVWKLLFLRFSVANNLQSILKFSVFLKIITELQ